jgi:hypothetical protein
MKQCSPERLAGGFAAYGVPGSVSGSRRATIEKSSLLRAEGFSCSLDVLYGGLGISKLQFLIKKR